MRVWATRPFGYNIPRNGPEMDRGQIFELEGFPNDDVLIRLGYVEEVARGTDIAQCDECGAEFAKMPDRAAHVKKRHTRRALDARQEDALEDREVAQLERVAPLKLENSAASLS